MDKETLGVRDEVGFLTIHQRYSDHFFPGTSVLHGRARYALFVPWLIEDVAGKTGPQAERDLRERQRLLAGRLKEAKEAKVIGGNVYPKPSSQPPSTVYWNALGIWGILRRRDDGRAISRSQAFHLLKGGGRTTDDDGQPLHSFDPPFVELPKRPPTWQKGRITLRLTHDEAKFLRNRLEQLHGKDSKGLSLLARLVRTKVSAPERMWNSSVRDIAGPDGARLGRARQAASLAGIGRAVYDALVETMAEEDGIENPTTDHREHLKKMVAEHGATAAGLDIAALEADISALPWNLRAVVEATKTWIVARLTDPMPLLDVYTRAEARKGLRARLAPSPNGRARRLEWSNDPHGLAEPLHYRWAQVRTLLDDLANAG